MDELSEKDLILAAILGDLRAFDQLALQYRSALLIIASRIVPIEESEDPTHTEIAAEIRDLTWSFDFSELPTIYL